MWAVWLPVAAYAALIFTLSSVPQLAPPTGVNHIDKLAHFLEYGILGALLARAFGHTLPGGRSLFHAALAVAMGGAVAAADEVYQGTVGREQDLADWAADMVGLVVAATLVAARQARPRFERRDTTGSTNG